MEKLFEIPIEEPINENSHQIAENLTQEAKNVDELHIWTDCDREGEAIGYEIVEHVWQTNPNVLVKRAKFSAITA